MTQERWIPPEIPLDKPNAARIYDYLLGGYHNFEQDRTVAEQMVQIYPDLFLTAQVNRSFLRRAVTFLLGQGIDQFLDIGSGIPTMGNVHEVVQAANSQAQVVYVDVEPVAVAHGRTMLAGNERAVAIRADVREPETILVHPEVERLLDFERPVGLLMVALLHYVVDDDVAYRAVSRLRQAMAPGSYMALAQTTPVTSAEESEMQEEMIEAFRSASDTKPRTARQLAPLFGSWALVEPGLVLTPLWRPDGPDDVFVDEPERGFTLAGVARKRAGDD
jgi:hypothetical protein